MMTDFIDKYASTACVDRDDVLEILYTMCSSCPMSVNNRDKLALAFNFPNGKSIELFSFETAPASLVFRMGNLRRCLDDYGYFPFEAESLINACMPHVIAKNDENLYLDLTRVVEHLHVVVDALKDFTNSMYIGAQK